MSKLVLPTVAVPESAPIMVLPGTVLFPGAVLPLHIFEPRYRQTLEGCLRADRMFCVALLRPNCSEARSPDDFFGTGGIGVIRACVKKEDGTSNLLLHGMARVAFDGFVQDRPFWIARLRRIESVAGRPEETCALALRLIELCREIGRKGADLPPALDRHDGWDEMPEQLCDLIGHGVIADTLQRQQILEEPDLARRLRLAIGYLRRAIESD